MACGLALVLSISQEAAAQFEAKPMAIGDLQHTYSELGAEGYPPPGPQMAWEGIYPYNGRQWYNTLWVAAKNVKDEAGEVWPVRIVHAGPRASGSGEYFPQVFKTISRFAPPDVTVDRQETFQFFPDNDSVDANLQADRMILNRVNTLTGITMERKIMAFSQEHHDDYHLLEYTFTNTGNIDDDDEIENPDETLEGVYFHFQRRPQDWGGAGGAMMNDIVGDGKEDYGTDLRALYAWPQPRPGSDWSLGFPVDRQRYFAPQEGDTLGRLSATHFVGSATVHADRSAGDVVNDMSQPSMTSHIQNDDDLMTSNNDAFNPEKMPEEYAGLSRGHVYPHHADIVDPDGDFTTVSGDPAYAGTFGYMFSYGPYTLAPGEDVKIVLVEAVEGLTRVEGVELGRLWKQAGKKEDAPLTYRGRTMTKNEWVMSGRDSLFQTFERAIANYQSGYALPQPPPPPSEFHVVSGVDAVALNWEVYPGATAPGGFEIYRSKEAREGAVSQDFQYELIATLGPEARSHEDRDVIRGIDYYYYIQAVGAPAENDGSVMTPPGALKSSRYWTQTYAPARLKRPPGETMAAARVVPNPYNIGSAQEVRWPDQQDKLGFLNIPGQSVIRIYTEVGELIKTIVHDDGSGDAYWDLATEDRQVVVTGIYIAIIDNVETGERAYKKFTIIR